MGALPGQDLIETGLSDLDRGVESPEALLVSIGAPRLRALGFDVSKALPDPELRLYELLAAYTVAMRSSFKRVGPRRLPPRGFG